MKRSFQRSKIVRARSCGFRKRKKKNPSILVTRRTKGRWRLIVR